MFTAAPLDSTAYPHILDRVLELADAESLIALGATCKTFRRHAKRVLYRHIVFVEDSVGVNSGDYAGLAIYAGGPPLTPLRPLGPQEARGLDNQVQSTPRPGLFDQAEEEDEKLLDLTEVVDMHTSMGFSIPSLHMNSLRLVRTCFPDVHPYPSFPPPYPERDVKVPGTADFRHISDWDQIHDRVFVLHVQLDTWPVVNGQLTISVPSHTLRLVLHLYWDVQLPPWLKFDLSRDAVVRWSRLTVDHFADISVVLHPPPTPFPAQGYRRGWFENLLSALGSLVVELCGRATIVGLENCSLAHLGLHCVEERQDIRDLVEATLAAMWRRGECRPFERQFPSPRDAFATQCRNHFWQGKTVEEGLGLLITYMTLSEWRQTSDFIQSQEVYRQRHTLTE